MDPICQPERSDLTGRTGLASIMANTILVLEDDADRTASMREVLVTHFASHELVFIDNAPDVVEWLRQHLREAVLICLDHDLGPNRERNGETFDPGIGRDVVEYMVTLEPVCPVLVHSTNSPAAYGMKVRLKEAGWKCSRVIPFDALEWVKLAWFPKVKKYLGGSHLG
jgi:hypothetical protein